MALWPKEKGHYIASDFLFSEDQELLILLGQLSSIFSVYCFADFVCLFLLSL
jgi:hypothetical protein